MTHVEMRGQFVGVASLPPSTIWVLGTELRLSELVASLSTYHAISPDRPLPCFKYLFIKHMSMPECMYVCHVHAGLYGGQKKVSDFLEPKSQAVESCREE